MNLEEESKNEGPANEVTKIPDDRLSKPAYPGNSLSDGKATKKGIKSEKSEKRQQSGTNC